MPKKSGTHTTTGLSPSCHSARFLRAEFLSGESSSGTSLAFPPPAVPRDGGQGVDRLAGVQTAALCMDTCPVASHCNSTRGAPPGPPPRRTQTGPQTSQRSDSQPKADRRGARGVRGGIPPRYYHYGPFLGSAIYTSEAPRAPRAGRELTEELVDVRVDLPARQPVVGARHMQHTCSDVLHNLRTRLVADGVLTTNWPRKLFTKFQFTS